MKKHGIISIDAEKPSRELSEAVLATRSALSLALDKPNKAAVGTNATGTYILFISLVLLILFLALHKKK